MKRFLIIGIGLLCAFTSTGNLAAAQTGITPDPSFAQSSPLTELDSVMYPVQFGQTDLTVYIPQTGHTIDDMMLDYWRANGASTVYGFPISEPYAAANGLYSQAFERGVLQYNPDWTGTDNPWIRLAPIGKATMLDNMEGSRSDGRRTGRSRTAEAYTPAGINETTATTIENAGGYISPTTGFSITGDFLNWWNSHEGAFYLGAPISEQHAYRGVTAQWFTNGLLLSNGKAVWVAPLTRETPDAFGIDVTRVAQNGLPEFSESLFVQTENPYGVDVTAVSGRKYIVVSLNDQTLRAYQGDQLVLETLVSTGLNPNSTEIGNFHVRIKRPSQTMSGFTSATGEVVSTGGGDGGQGLQRYEVADVPDVMYFNYQAEALHGAYWHNNFGNRMSHGCVNLPLNIASFLYQWAPLGTAVTVMQESFAN